MKVHGDDLGSMACLTMWLADGCVVWKKQDRDGGRAALMWKGGTCGLGLCNILCNLCFTITS
jgi:hypothetical protein